MSDCCFSFIRQFHLFLSPLPSKNTPQLPNTPTVRIRESKAPTYLFSRPCNFLLRRRRFIRSPLIGSSILHPNITPYSPPPWKMKKKPRFPKNILRQSYREVVFRFLERFFNRYFSHSVRLNFRKPHITGEKSFRSLINKTRIKLSKSRSLKIFSSYFLKFTLHPSLRLSSPLGSFDKINHRLQPPNRIYVRIRFISPNR